MKLSKLSKFGEYAEKLKSSFVFESKGLQYLSSEAFLKITIKRVA